MRGLKRKKIVIDVRLIKSSGIGRYIREILTGIIELDANIVLLGNKEELLKNYRSENVHIINCNYSIYSLLGQFILPFFIGKCDVFWSPHFSSTFLPVFAKKRITTIHDAFHLSNKNYLSKFQYYYAKILYYFAVLLSTDIITVSKFSSDELSKYFNVKNKLNVIYNGVDYTTFSLVDRKQRDLIKGKYPLNYILCVGNVKPHKNLKVVVEAFNKIILEDDELYLIIVGKKEGFVNSDTKLLDFYANSNRIIFTGFVEDKELISLYQCAKCFIFPSLYEGFGLPPLEALAAGTRVLVSNMPPMDEVCGQMVEYFDPFDPIALSSLILKEETKIADNEEVLRFLNKYNWKNCIKLHLKYFFE